MERVSLWLLGGILIENLFLDEEYNFFIKKSMVNLVMIILVLVIYLIILTIKIQIAFRLGLLLVVLYGLMIVRDFFVFIFLYEIVFILILFRLMFLGYRYERLIASFLIIFYSFLFSRPVIIIIVIIDKVFLIKEWLLYNRFMRYFLVGSFLVKFPIFGFHYWLPVAHVEASTLGSILLAGVLLKLGCLGVIYVIQYLKFIVKFHWLVLGVLLTILIIVSLRDLKIIIAYSSVAHIRIVYYVLIIGDGLGISGRVIIMFYHGFVSPVMFWLVGLLVWWKTRSLMVVKFMVFSVLCLYIIFLLVILNMSFPPIIGFLREIYILKAIIKWWMILGLISISILLTCFYNIYLFWGFSNIGGIIFKLRVSRVDVWVFLLLSWWFIYY